MSHIELTVWKQIHGEDGPANIAEDASANATALVSLLKNHRENFIEPDNWARYKDLLDACIPHEDKLAREAFRLVNLRNARVCITNPASPLAGRPQLVRLLDETLLNHIEPQTAQKCWATGDDKVDIVKTTVDWATTFYRAGLARVYTAANLIGQWSAKLSVNMTGAILEHVDTIPAAEEDRKQMVYLLVRELVRTGHFSVSQYIKWLEARGAGRLAYEVDDDDSPCTTRLLVHLPLRFLTQEQRDDRDNMLRRAELYLPGDEAQEFESAIMFVNQTLGAPVRFDQSDADREPLPLNKLVRRLVKSTKALQSAVAFHLCQTVAHLVDSAQPVPPHLFSVMRAILEETQDFYALYDVLRCCARATNVDVLALCVDTLNANLDVFYALDVAGRLFDLFLDRQDQEPLPSRPLLASLCFLSRRMPTHKEIVSYLARRLAESDRNNPIDACSPISDNMVNPPSGADGEISERIEKLLASGKSINPPTMNRLFFYIIKRLEVGWTKLDDSRRIHVALLTRLRLFDPEQFDTLMGDWVGRVRSLKSREPLADIFPLLIITEALSIPILLGPASLTQLHPPEDADAAAAPPDVVHCGADTYLQELLHLLLLTKLPRDNHLLPEEAYRFGVYQKSILTNHAEGLLLLMRHAVVEYGGLRVRVPEATMLLDSLSFRKRLANHLRHLLVVRTAEVTEAFSAKNIPPEGSRLMREVIGQLFRQDSKPKWSSSSPSSSSASSSDTTEYDQTLLRANELTMPFCQLKLNMELSVAPPRPTADASSSSPSSQYDSFGMAMGRAIQAQNLAWMSMLPCLSKEISAHLQSQACSRILELVPSPSSSKDADSLREALSNNSHLYLAENLLGVIEAIVVGQQPPPDTPQLTTVLADKLSDLIDIIIAPKDEANADALILPITEHWLPMLLKFVLLHSVSSERVPPVASCMSVSTGKVYMPPYQEARAQTVLTLCRLYLVLEALSSRLVTRELLDQVCDVAMVLADRLPNDLRLHCAKSIFSLVGWLPSQQVSSQQASSQQVPTQQVPGQQISTQQVSSQQHVSSDAWLFHYIFSVPRPAATDALMLGRTDKTTPHRAMYGMRANLQERLSPYLLRRWELLPEPTPMVGLNDTSISLGLFEAIRIH